MTLRNHYCSMYASQCICMLCCTLLIFFQRFSFYLKHTHTDPHICMCWFFWFFFTCIENTRCTIRISASLLPKLFFSHMLQFTPHYTLWLSAHSALCTPKHTCTHPNAETRTSLSSTVRTHAHTLCGGKSLALAAYYLSYKFASTGGCHGDNKAYDLWTHRVLYWPAGIINLAGAKIK